VLKHFSEIYVKTRDDRHSYLVALKTKTDFGNCQSRSHQQQEEFFRLFHPLRRQPTNCCKKSETWNRIHMIIKNIIFSSPR